MPLRAVLAFVILAATGCAPAPAPAASAPPSAPFSAAPRCEGPEYHRLDFWLGEWDVLDPSGARDGSNVIASTLDGCAVEERWEDATGWRGTSLFSYDRAARTWRQTWATSTGATKEKRESVGAPPGAIRFAGLVPRASGGAALDRTTLSPETGDRVRQVIEQSTDGGATWTRWEGLYVRKKPAAACAGAEHRQFDFWIGDWDLVVRARKAPDSEEWQEARGENRIRATHAGCAIEERFRADGPGDPWDGQSESVLVGTKWRQTWVDDQGSYLAFTGERTSSEMILYGEPQTKDGKRTQMRMVFTEIRPASLKWRWERTTDDGASYRPMMTIDYRRRR